MDYSYSRFFSAPGTDPSGIEKKCYCLHPSREKAVGAQWEEKRARTENWIRFKWVWSFYEPLELVINSGARVNIIWVWKDKTIRRAPPSLLSRHGTGNTRRWKLWPLQPAAHLPTIFSKHPESLCCTDCLPHFYLVPLYIYTHSIGHIRPKYLDIHTFYNDQIVHILSILQRTLCCLFLELWGCTSYFRVNF